MADCITCEDGRYACPDQCPSIPPGSMAEQAMADLAVEYELDVSDVDGRL
ncbi:hypothetical protein [Streptomyces microflavus]|uniref:Ferredoxin n=1 Tax=Streptomyces microflavus TaxID=1919 RepID=A0ABV1QFG6_STRMI